MSWGSLESNRRRRTMHLLLTVVSNCRTILETTRSSPRMARSPLQPQLHSTANMPPLSSRVLPLRLGVQLIRPLGAGCGTTRVPLQPASPTLPSIAATTTSLGSTAVRLPARSRLQFMASSPPPQLHHPHQIPSPIHPEHAPVVLLGQMLTATSGFSAAKDGN